MVSSAAPTPGAVGTRAGGTGGRQRRRVWCTRRGWSPLRRGPRIADALDAAGGLLDGADVMGLNMARRVTDGEQIVVGIGAPPGLPVEMGSSIVSDPAASAGPVAG